MIETVSANKSYTKVVSPSDSDDDLGLFVIAENKGE